MTTPVEHSHQTPGSTSNTFQYVSHVHFDELDPMGVLHNARYAVHVERAVTAFFASQGFLWDASLAENPDKWHAVRRFEVDLERPFTGTGPLLVDLWLTQFGRTSCGYGFACRGVDDRLHAHGVRTVVKLDPATFRPTEWTTRWREAHLSALPLVETSARDAASVLQASDVLRASDSATAASVAEVATR